MWSANDRPADALLACVRRGEAVVYVDMTTSLGKRKRALVSYSEDNDELDQLIFGDGVAKAEDDHDDNGDIAMIDDDAEFGKKASKKAVAIRRQMKKAKLDTASKRKLAEKPFPFLKLPLELRYMIYGHALTDYEVALCAKHKSYRRTVTHWNIEDWELNYHGYVTDAKRGQVEPPKHFAPSLLATNKQIHDEGVFFLYNQRFVFQDLYALHSFLAEIGPRNCRFVTDVTIKTWGFGRGVHRAMNFCAFTMLALCTNLRSLTLDCDMDWGYSSNPKRLARTVYRNAHHFFEAFGVANGRRDAAMDIIRLKETNFDHFSYSHHGTKPVGEKQHEKAYKAELRRLLGV
nr:hypothetical protein CFP56_31545 [Quercus suber]